jgi:hypothetical protein
MTQSYRARIRVGESSNEAKLVGLQYTALFDKRRPELLTSVVRNSIFLVLIYTAHLHTTAN